MRVRRALALVLAMAMIAPVTALADAKKHFKEGLRYEENRQWDKAAEKFALAVAEKPSNVEYQLHLQRSLVLAAIMLVERGDQLADQKDYNAAYQAYRQAYAFDPTNEMAYIKMRNMLEAQGLPTDNLPSIGDPAGPKTKPTKDQNQKASFIRSAKGIALPATNAQGQPTVIPVRRFGKTDVIARSDNLLSVIEQLGQDMKLNVVFDQQVTAQMRNNKLAIELRDVTKPKALEIILKTNNLMYSQLDARTIVIALDNPASRARYEPLAVRTFYIKNADITEVRGAIQASLQSKNLVPVKQLNALIVRDSPANLELIESMIDSMDKAKAEVLIDVNIYEVSRNDLLSIGNQFNPEGDASKNIPGLPFLGGIGRSGVQQNAERTLTGKFGFALGLPTSAISFFQDKGKAKLLASTQVHVLDTEQHTIRIGQRVPIQTAVFQSPTITIPRGNNNQNNQNNNGLNVDLGGFGGFGNGAFPQIQYENVGLNIDMKPSVFEDEVQMTMKIESTSVDSSTGRLTPSFNQRTMNSVARIKDGQTTLVAGVSQTTESKRVKGLPLIGLIPILGRFFSTPETEDRQSDVVITVTPHILRRPDFREEDHLARDAGTSADPTTQLTIEQILYLADVEDANQNQVASSGGAAPEVPAAQNKTVLTVPSPTTPINAPPSTNQQGVVVIQPTVSNNPAQPPPAARPNVQRRTVDAPGVQPNEDGDEGGEDDEDGDAGLDSSQRNGPILVSVKSAAALASKGQDLYVAIIVNGNADISGTTLSLSYDPNILDVKAVRDGGLLRAGGANPELQFSAEGGMLNVQLERPPGSGGVPARGQLLLLVFNVKNQGQSMLTLNDQTAFRGPNGQVIPVRLQSTQIEAR
ncbi:MAG TPA: secretin N-terminal domain-containing protein [Blastocatellia bacterium]|nr:secretin N-terminal domain-containing protein [Blastocatellia bacterium]